MPTDLLRLYRELSTEVKRMATRERVGVRTYWIGKTVQRLLDAGGIQLGIDVRPPGTATVQ
jgi:hypothetical protein